MWWWNRRDGGSRSPWSSPRKWPSLARYVLAEEACAVGEDLGLRAFRDVLAAAKKLDGIEDAMRVRQVRRVKDALIAYRFRHHADPGLVELAAEIHAPAGHVLARIARRQVGLLRPARRLLVEALHAIEPERHPFDAGLEEAHLQPGEALQHAADQQA